MILPWQLVATLKGCVAKPTQKAKPAGLSMQGGGLLWSF
jgi:hypothetical protein